MGYAPKLLMGDKRTERNVHCALQLPIDGEDFLLDPGYLIFDPLKIPENIPFQKTQSFFRWFQTPSGWTLKTAFFRFTPVPSKAR